LEKGVYQVEELSQRNFIWKKEKNNQLNDWKSWMSELNVKVFVVGKPDNPNNFSTGRERSGLKNIGTIFIALQLH
jgi:hypothetical protein